MLRASERGPFETRSLDEMTLESRQRSIPVRVTAPIGDQPAPILIWSHGANGSKDGYAPLRDHWASHGYVVIQPTHGDSLSLAEPNELRRAGGLRARTASAAVGRHWRTRPIDIRTVLDSLGTIEKAVSTLGDVAPFDEDRVAVGGHSFGAHTTLMVAGMTLVGGGRQIAIADARPRCFLAVSPQGRGRSTNDGSWKAVTRPTLFVSGTEDRSPIRDDPPESRRDPFDLCAPGDKLLAWIDGAHHGFGGIAGAARYPEAGPASPAQVILIKSLTTSFLDAHLRGDEDARRFVTSDAPADASDVGVELLRR